MLTPRETFLQSQTRPIDLMTHPVTTLANLERRFARNNIKPPRQPKVPPPAFERKPCMWSLTSLSPLITSRVIAVQISVCAGPTAKGDGLIRKSTRGPRKLRRTDTDCGSSSQQPPRMSTTLPNMISTSPSPFTHSTVISQWVGGDTGTIRLTAHDLPR